MMSREKPQAATPAMHPEKYERDLNPKAMAGRISALVNLTRRKISAIPMTTKRRINGWQI